MGVKCFVQEHNTVLPLSARTQTAGSRFECTKRGATALSPQRERKGNTDAEVQLTWKKGFAIKQLHSQSEIVFHYVNFARTVIVCRNSFANTKERFL